MSETLCEVLEHRGIDQPERRAELLDEIHLACAAMTDAGETLRASLEADLEGRRFPGTPLGGVSETAYFEASDRFGKAREAAVRFLLDNGGKVEDPENETTVTVGTCNLGHADERAALSDRVMDAKIAVERAIGKLQTALCCALEHDERRGIGPAEAALIDAEVELDEARTEAVRFMLGKGGWAHEDLNGEQIPSFSSPSSPTREG